MTHFKRRRRSLLTPVSISVYDSSPFVLC